MTQSFDQEKADKMIKHIEGEINLIKKDEEDNDNIKILKVLAEDEKINDIEFKAYGISNLMKVTSELAKHGIESSCFESLIKQTEKIIRKDFDDNINDLKKYIFNENLSMKLPDLDEGKDQLSIITDLLEKDDDSIPIFGHFDFIYFTRFICQFSGKLARSLLFKDKDLEKKSLFDLYNIMKVKGNDIRNYFEAIFDKKLGKLTSQMAEKLDILTHDIDSTFNISHLSSKYSHNQLKIQAKNNIINNLKPDIEDQVYKEVSKILYDIYAENFSNKLLEIFRGLLDGDEPDEKIEKFFVDKGKKITENFYNKIVKLLDYPNDDYVEKKKKGKNYKERLKRRKEKPQDNKKGKDSDEDEDEEVEDEKKDKKENKEKKNKKENKKDKKGIKEDKKGEKKEEKEGEKDEKEEENDEKEEEKDEKEEEKDQENDEKKKEKEGKEAKKNGKEEKVKKKGK